MAENTTSEQKTVQNKNIFNSVNTIDTIHSLRINSLQENNMSADEATYFNTYRYWTPFWLPMQNVIKDGSSKDEKGNPVMEAISAKGVKSLFNNFNAVFVDNEYRTDANMPLLDNPESRVAQRANTCCTIKSLVEDSAKGLMGRQVYNYSDFAFCKHLGKVSNNYLITLRRFGAPCGDKIDKRVYNRMAQLEEKLQGHMPDIGRMVTWLGTSGNEMSNILKYSYNVAWEDLTAKIDEVDTKGEEGIGPIGGLFNMANSNYRTQVQRGMAGTNFAGKTAMDNMLGCSTNPPYSKAEWDKMYDANKVYGPLDVIMKTKKRKQGINFEQKFSLTFDYELRSYYGVNGKAAMVDLLGNILATTFTHGTFWGGERRFVGVAQDNIFANLPIYKLADSGGLNNPGAVMDAFMESINQGAKAFSQGVKGDSTMDKIKNLAKDVGGMLLGGLLNKLGRPHKYALSSLLSPAPVGCWHLTVGNPKSPIIEVGNLIMTNATVTHYGPLGLDDFPTGLRVVVELEHAKPRDIMGIEQMYGRGDTRIYSPLGARVLDMYNTATTIVKINSESKTKKDESKKTMQNTTSPNDNMSSPVVTEDSSTISNVQTKTYTDVTSLERYFGTNKKELIVAAGGESLYGTEKHKNDHVAK